MIIAQAILGFTLLSIAIYWPLWKLSQHVQYLVSVQRVCDRFAAGLRQHELEQHPKAAQYLAEMVGWKKIDYEWMHVEVMITLDRWGSQRTKTVEVFDSPALERLVEDARVDLALLMYDHAWNRTLSGAFVRSALWVIRRLERIRWVRDAKAVSRDPSHTLSIARLANLAT